MTALTTVTDALNQHGLKAMTRGNHVQASCPAHEDKAPSLSVDYRGERVLLTCHAGCTTEAILAGLGLDWPDLFDGEQQSTWGEPLVEYEYLDPDGKPYMYVGRFVGKKFMQRRPGMAYKQGLGDLKPILYRLDKVLAGSGTLYIVEGEKDVHAVELSLRRSNTPGVATTSPGGAGKWRDYMASWVGQRYESIVIVADKDSSGTGLRHAQQVAESLERAGCGVPDVRQAKAGKDAFDHVSQGYALSDMGGVDPTSLLPNGLISGMDLHEKEFPPQRWVLPGILETGLAMLGGPPKLGKSYLAQDLALACSSGGNAWGSIPSEHGDVLYLALDNDSERRLKDRQDYLLGYCDPDSPLRIHYSTDWPTGQDAIAACQSWARMVGDPRLIVVDTVSKVEPEFTSDRNGYQTSVDIAARWNTFAASAGVCVLFIHHDRKTSSKDAGDEDWINRFLGSRGITASVQTLMFLDTKRGDPMATLRMSGRDIEGDDIDLTRVGRQWQAFSKVTV